MKHGELNGIDVWGEMEQKGSGGEARAELFPEKAKASDSPKGYRGGGGGDPRVQSVNRA